MRSELTPPCQIRQNNRCRIQIGLLICLCSVLAVIQLPSQLLVADLVHCCSVGCPRLPCQASKEYGKDYQVLFFCLLLSCGLHSPQPVDHLHAPQRVRDMLLLDSVLAFNMLCGAFLFVLFCIRLYKMQSDCGLSAAILAGHHHPTSIVLRDVPLTIRIVRHLNLPIARSLCGLHFPPSESRFAHSAL